MSNFITKKLVTISHIAHMFGVSKATIRNWERAGKLTSTLDENGVHKYDLDAIQEAKQPHVQNLDIKPVLEDQLLSIDDASAMLGVSRTTLLRWENAGLLQSTKTLGGLRRYAGRDLVRLKNNRSSYDPMPMQDTPSTVPIQASTPSMDASHAADQPQVSGSDMIEQKLREQPLADVSFVSQIAARTSVPKSGDNTPLPVVPEKNHAGAYFLSALIPTAAVLFIVGVIGTTMQLAKVRRLVSESREAPVEAGSQLAQASAETGKTVSDSVSGSVLGASEVMPSPIMGMTGAMGFTGPTGLIGVTGETGPTGVQGFAGLIGPSGAIGSSGATGSTGPGGSVGSTGATGSVGSTGASGPTGATGQRGANGENLFNQLNNLVFLYPSVDRSLALGSNLGANQSTTSTASALILLDGTSGTIRAQGFSVGSQSGITQACAAGQTLNHFSVTGGLVTDGVCTDNNADLAESYFSQEKLEKGDIVEIDPGHPVSVRKTQNPYAAATVGIITTSPWNVLGGGDLWNVVYPVALVGRVPVKVTNETGVIAIGDAIASGSLSGYGMKALRPGVSVARALQSTDTWNESSCPVASSVDAIQWPQDDGTNSSMPCFRVPRTDRESSTGDYLYVGKIMAFVQHEAAAISSPSTPTQSAIDQLLALLGFSQGAIGSSLVSGSSSPYSVLSPLGSDGKHVVLSLDTDKTFDVTGKNNEPVLSVSDSGASVSSTLVSKDIFVSHDATISGTLYADRIIGRIQDLSGITPTPAMSVNNITTIIYASQAAELPLLTTSPSVPEAVLDATSSSLLAHMHIAQDSIASADGTLVELPRQKITIDASVFVEGATHLGETTVAGALLANRLDVGSDGVQVFGDRLYLQKNKLAIVDLGGGILQVNPWGNVVISGDLAVTGNVSIGGVLGVQSIDSLGKDLSVSLSSIEPIEASNAASNQSEFIIRGASDSAVARISASGSAQFNQSIQAKDAQFLGDIVSSGSARINGLAVGSQTTGVNVPVASRQYAYVVTGILQGSNQYGVYVLPSWNTTTWITNKSETGFIIHFGTASPVGGGTMDWFLVEKK